MESLDLVTQWIGPKEIHSRNKSSNARVSKKGKQTQDGGEIGPKEIHSRNKSSNARVSKKGKQTRDGGEAQGDDHRYDLRPRSRNVNIETQRTRSPSQERKVTSGSKSNKNKTDQSGSKDKATGSKDVSMKDKPSSSRTKSRTKKAKNRRNSRASKAVSIRNRARSTSPSPCRIDSSATSENVKNLKQRIKSIPIKNRNVPRTNDIGLLGFELKTRLAMTSPVLTETVRRGGKVKVKSRRVKKRFIPLWEISKQQDPLLICQMYTFVPKVRTEDHKRRGDKPSMQIIDHRKRNNRVVSRSLPTETTALEIVMDQRNELFDNELGYKRRIKEMESDATHMAAELEKAVIENRSLKNNMNRGPNRSDAKRLADEKKTLQNAVDKLAEENFELNDLLNRVTKRSEDEWREVFENVRRRQEERYSVIGPFVSRVQGLKKRTVAMNDGPEMNKDVYDRHLTHIEKETQSLLNRLKQLKREKRVIDYALVTGERKCMINYKEFKEVGANMNRDLTKFATQLDTLSGKHVEMIDALQESRGLHDKAIQTEEEEKPEPEIVEVKTPKKKTKKVAVEKLPPIQANNKTLNAEVGLPVNNDISLPAINNGNMVERQRTIVKSIDKGIDANSANKVNTLSNSEELDRSKTKDNGKKSPIKTFSPSSNRSKRSNETKASNTTAADTIKKEKEGSEKKSKEVVKIKQSLLSPKETGQREKEPVKNKPAITPPKGTTQREKEPVKNKEKQKSPRYSRKVDKEADKAKQTVDSKRGSGTTNIAKMVANAKVEKAPHR